MHPVLRSRIRERVKCLNQIAKRSQASVPVVVIVMVTALTIAGWRDPTLQLPCALTDNGANVLSLA